MELLDHVLSQNHASKNFRPGPPLMVRKWWGTLENTCNNMVKFMYPTTLYSNWCRNGVKIGGGTKTAKIIC